ncbi:MAG: cation:proton antiporter [Candidatus Lutacidiplasmatales archaeon]
MAAVLLGASDYYVLLEIFILLAVAQVIHNITRRAGFPDIVAALVTGMLIGGYALGGVFDSALGVSLFTVNTGVLLFADLSVVLLLFSAGLGVGFTSLRQAGLPAVGAAIAGDLAPFLLTYAVFSQIYPTDQALIIAVASAATSTAVVAALIRGDKLQVTQGARFLLNAAALDDVVALVLLSIILALLGGHTNALVLTGGIATSVIAWVLLLLASVVVVPRLLRARILRDVENLPFTMLFVLIALVLALGFSPIIGAYIAGLAVAESAVAPRTREVTAVLVGIFGPLFFIVIGAEFNVGLLRDPVLIGFAALLALTAAGGKILGVFPYALKGLGSSRKAATVAVGMIPRSEIGLTVGAIGFSSGLLTERMLGEIVVMAIVTTLVGSVLFRWLSPALSEPAETTAPLPP